MGDDEEGVSKVYSQTQSTWLEPVRLAFSFVQKTDGSPSTSSLCAGYFFAHQIV